MFRPVLLACVFTLSSLLSACGGGGDGGADTPTTQPVALNFTAALGTTALASPCGAPLPGLGSTPVNAKLKDLRFYVSNLHLINAAGAEVKVTLAANANQLTRGADSVALIDLRDTTVQGDCAPGNGHFTITGTVPAGSYTAVAFTLGVPETLNHVDPFDVSNAPLDNLDLGWDWTGGKKHLQVEINPENATTPGSYVNGITRPGSAAATTFALHLGNTGCANPAAGVYSCDNINTRDIHFHNFNLATQRIAVDLQALFAASNLQRDLGEAVGCMSSATDPECANLWPVLGATFSAAGANVIDPLNSFLHGETVFKAIAK
jgi:uncharacterized repeat protein (TIGR04052 family)